MSKLESMSAAVIETLDGYPVGHQFHGNELHNDVARIYPPARTMYTDTIQRMMRRHCGHLYKTINQNKSLYEKICCKLITKQVKEVALPKVKSPVIRLEPMKQGELVFQ